MDDAFAGGNTPFEDPFEVGTLEGMEDTRSIGHFEENPYDFDFLSGLMSAEDFRPAEGDDKSQEWSGAYTTPIEGPQESCENPPEPGHAVMSEPVGEDVVVEAAVAAASPAESSINMKSLLTLRSVKERKRPPKRVPDHEKDESYHQYRQKNREAARRSRDRRRQVDIQRVTLLNSLLAERNQLLQRLQELETEKKLLQELINKRHQP